MKVGIVGVRRGSSFFRFNQLDGVEVDAICDLSYDVLNDVGERQGISPGRRFQDYEDLLGSDVDAVVISTPPDYHAEQAALALEAGKHVLSEVPAAETIEQCRRLVAAAEASGAVYQMAENYCYQRSVTVVRELVGAGLFGEVYYGEGEYLHDCRHLLFNPDGSMTWRGERRLKTNGIDYPTHSVGPLAWIFDDRPASVACLGSGSRRDPELTHDDSCVGLVRTAKGKLWKIRVDWHSLRPHNMNYYQVQGTRGCWEAPRGMGDDHKIWLADRCEDPNAWLPLSALEDEFLPEAWRNPPKAAVGAGHGGGDWWELVDFVGACRGLQPPAVDVYDAVSWSLVGIRSGESLALGGQPLPIDNPREWAKA